MNSGLCARLAPFAVLVPALCLCLTLLAVPALAAAKKNPASPQTVPAAAPNTAPAGPAGDKNVYDQPPFTEKELLSFMDTLPQFRRWVRETRAAVNPQLNSAGKPDFVYPPEAAAKARELGWAEPKRFFCLLGRTAAALYLVEEGTDLTDKLPKDMPKVADSEIALVRKHLGSLLRAGNDGPPPAMAR